MFQIYKEFPPKRKDQELKGKKQKTVPHDEVKKRLQKAILHYHPDKQDEKEHGMKWKVLCEEITKLFTRRYECFKC